MSLKYDTKGPDEISSGPSGIRNRYVLVGVNGDLLAIPAHAFEFYDTLDQREEGVVLAAADVVTGVDLGAALTIDDIAGLDGLAAELLATESLTVRIPAVT